MRRIGVGLLITGLVSTIPAAPARAATGYLHIEDTRFVPASVTVKPGTELRWENVGTKTHTVTEVSNPALFDSGPLQPGSTYQRVFDATVSYRCKIHGFTGKVTVSAGAGPPPSATPSASPTPARTASPSASPTPKKTKSPSPTASATPRRSASPSPTPSRTASPTPSPTGTATLRAAAPRPSGGTRAPVAIALVVLLGAGAALVYRRFIHGT